MRTGLSLLLIAIGAGLTLVVTGGQRRSPRTSLSQVVADGAPISTRAVTHIVDPAIVDIDTVVQTPAGPTDVAGTGMVLTSSGDIVTNNHVVKGATTIKVIMPTEHRSFVAHFVGSDPGADVAVIRIVGVSGLPTVRLASDARVSVGERILAIGNALGLDGLPSVTDGTVAGIARSINATSETGMDLEHLHDMIETDAPIAPGSSGGPIVDRRGRVIGMNTAASPTGTGIGALSDVPVAFAIPAQRVERIARQILAGIAGNGVELGRPAYLGIEGTTVSLITGSEPSGVNIIQVEPDTPASRAGLEPGDVILRFDGQPTPTMADLSNLIGHQQPGADVSLLVEEGGSPHSLNVSLVAGPAP